MNKKIVTLIIAFPAMFLFFIFKVIPAITSLIISMKDYSVFKGVFGSPGVGGQNFSTLFRSPAFPVLIKNTFVLNTLSIALTCIIASILVICILKMPNKWCRLVSIIILAIPAFIPIVSYAGVFLKALYSDTGLFMTFGIESKSFFTDPAYYAILYALMDSLRNVYIPVMIGVLVCDTGKNTGIYKIGLVMIGYILIKATIFMSPDIETILITYNPLVYERADVFDTYLYRTGLMQGNFALSSTVWIIKTIAQISLNIVLYFVLAKLWSKLSETEDILSDRVNRGLDSIIGIIGYVLLAIGSIAVICIIIPAPGSLIDGTKMLLNNEWFISSILNSFKYGVIGCVVYGFITISLAYPLTAKSRFYPFILVIVMSITNNFIGEYIITRSLHTVNTVYPLIMSSCLSVTGAFALYFTVSSKFKDHIPNFSEYVRASILPLITIVALFFMANWGSYIYQLIYFKDRSLYGIGLFGREINLTAGGGSANDQMAFESIKAAYIFITSIIPISLGMILICLNKYLPLKAFSVLIRNN